MSRPLVGFLLFCIVLGGAVGMLAWWAGPTLLSLALDEKQRNEPYYLLHLAASGFDQRENYTRAYQTPMLQLLNDHGGRLLWQAETLQLFEGSVRDEWSEVALLKFGRGAEFVQMITSSQFRQISVANPVGRVVAGMHDAPAELSADATIVLYLFQLDEAVSNERPDMAQKMVNLGEYGGWVVWETSLSMIEGEAENWDRLLALQFGTVERAESWLRDPASVTERALAGRNLQQIVILLLRGSAQRDSEANSGGLTADEEQPD